MLLQQSRYCNHFHIKTTVLLVLDLCIYHNHKVPHRGNLPGTGVICSEISPTIILACHSIEYEIMCTTHLTVDSKVALCGISSQDDSVSLVETGHYSSLELGRCRHFHSHHWLNHMPHPIFIHWKIHTHTLLLALTQTYTLNRGSGTVGPKNLV